MLFLMGINFQALTLIRNRTCAILGCNEEINSEAGGVAQVIKHLLSKNEALSSKPSTGQVPVAHA
jgi:hypothetical protein